MSISASIDREALGGLADALIPAADGMPSATEAGSTGALLDEVLRVRGTRGAAGHATGPAAQRPERGDRPLQPRRRALRGLTTAIAGGYFMSDDVRERSATRASSPRARNDHDPALLQP